MMSQAIPDVSVSPPGETIAGGGGSSSGSAKPPDGANGAAGGNGASVDRFTIIRQIGQGGMGNVYLARHPVTGTEVALKCLKPELAGNPKAVKRFLAEARHMYHLNHPHVLRIMEVGEGPHGPYYVMPYMTAGALAASITRGTPTAPARTLAVAREVADALAYAHAKGILHRDLKPANVLIDDGGHACLGDFGMVHEFTTNDSVADPRASYCEGTVAYMSPAVARGEAEDTRCDIYAFGAMLCELLTGDVPYAAPNVRLTLELIASGPPVDILQRNPAAPRGLARIAEGCMARELRDRYARMIDVVADLERVAAGQRPIGPHGTWGRTPRGAAVAALIAAVLVGAALIATIAPRIGNDARHARGILPPHVPGLTTVPQVVPRPPTMVDLTQRIDAALDATPDSASPVPGGIRLTNSGANDRASLIFPYEPPAEYDLLIEFVRVEGDDGLDHCIVHGDRAFIWTLGGLGNNVSCFWRIGDANFGSGPAFKRRQGGWLTNNEVHESLISVRNGSVSAYLDGELVVRFKTDYQDVHFPKDEDNYPDSWGRRLGLSALRSDFVIRSVKVTELSGPGTFFPHQASNRHLVWARRAGMPRPYAVRFVRDGGVLVCTSSPNQVRHACSVWARDGHQTAAFDACWAAASPDGRRLVRAWDGGGLNVADVDGSNAKDFGSTLQGVPAAFSTDGGRIAHVRKPDLSTVRVISADGGGKVAELDVPNATWVGFSPDGGHVAAIGSREGTAIVMLQQADGAADVTAEVWTAELPSAPAAAKSASAAEFAADGKRLLVRTGTSVLCLSADANDKAEPRERIELPHGAPVVSAHFASPDGRYVVVATASPGDGLRLWDLAAPGAPVTRFTQKPGRIHAMELSPDGRWLAAGDDRGSIRLIDVNSGHEPATLTGHDAPVISLAISPDGKTIASGSEDGLVRMFNVPDEVTAGGK